MKSRLAVMLDVFGVVKAIDYGSRRLSVRDPQGNLLVAKAGDDVEGAGTDRGRRCHQRRRHPSR